MPEYSALRGVRWEWNEQMNPQSAIVFWKLFCDVLSEQKGRINVVQLLDSQMSPYDMEKAWWHPANIEQFKGCVLPARKNAARFLRDWANNIEKDTAGE